MRRSAVVVTLIAAFAFAGAPVIGPGAPVADAAKKSKKIGAKKKAKEKRLRKKCVAKGGTWNKKTRKCVVPRDDEDADGTDWDEVDGYDDAPSYEGDAPYDADEPDFPVDDD